MAQFLSPDVIVEEVQGKSGVISAPSTAAFAIAGFSLRGPEGKAYQHSSFKEFTDRFGGFSNKSLNTYIAAAFFQNGGSQLNFVRAMHSDATFASGSFVSGWNVKASGRGIWANDAEISISGNPNFYDQASASFSKFDLTVELVDSSTGLLTTSETFEALELVDDEDPDYMLKVIDDASEDISLTGSTGGIPDALKPVIYLAQAIGTGDGSATSFSGSFSGITPLAETAVKIKVNGVLVAQDDGEGALVDVSGGPVVSGTVNYETGAVSVVISPAPGIGDVISADLIKKPASSVTIVLAGGADGSAVELSDVTSLALASDKKGIYALDDIDSQMQLSLPDYAGDKQAILDIISYASNRRDILAIVEPPKGYSPQQAANFKRNVVSSVSSYGAMCYPWITVPDPLNKNRPKAIPPCGHMAGRMAYTDNNENVGKAPAGVIRGQLSFISGLERTLSKGDRDIVYQAQINPIRQDASVGTAIWGNKTMQVVGDFVEVNVRRTFIFLEKAQYVGLLDILFENVGPVTFALVKSRLDGFLETLWLGGVIGSGIPTKAQAFNVICDDTNNTPAIQAQHRIVVDEFVKPNISAEFIHLKIQRVFDATNV